VIASGSTVNTGAIDPLPKILELCRVEQVWLHVDGAYGAFAIRLCYIKPRPTLADVDGPAQKVERLGAQVWGEDRGQGIVS